MKFARPGQGSLGSFAEKLASAGRKYNTGSPTAQPESTYVKYKLNASIK
jgi:hypothetical protein